MIGDVVDMGFRPLKLFFTKDSRVTAINLQHHQADLLRFLFTYGQFRLQTQPRRSHWH